MSELIGANNYSVTKGARATGDVQSVRHVPQYTDDFISLNANTAPLCALMDKMGQNKDVKDVAYFSFLADMLPQTVTLSNSDSGTSTTITLASGEGSKLVPYAILYVERTNESILITAISTDTLTVTRAFGTGSASAAVILANEVIQVQGYAFPENSTAPSGLSSEPVQIVNYCQTFRRAIELSGRDVSLEVYGPDEMKRILKDAGEALQLDKEKAFLFSTSYNATSSLTASSKTNGLLGHISTNVTNQGGLLDEASAENIAINWYRRNFGQGASMYAFIGDNVMRAFDGFARDAVRYSTKDTVLGLEVKGWQCSAGEFKFMKHGLLSPLGSSQTAANRGQVGYMVGVNLKMVGTATFKGRGTRVEENVQLPGTDGKKTVLTFDGGLRVLSERAHCWVYGVTNN